MTLENYKSMYEKMGMSDEMDKKIKDCILNQKKIRKYQNKKIYHTGASIVAAIAIVVLALQVDSVSAAVQKIVSCFNYSFTVEDKKGNREQIKMSGEYLSLSKKAPKKECYMDSMEIASSKIGIDLLNTENASAFEDCITYTPYLSKNGELCGVMLIDELYALGDLQNVKMNLKKSKNSVDFIKYTAGEKYQTPVLAQITIQTNKKETEGYNNNELGYLKEKQNLDLTATNSDVSNVELYEIKNLGVKAVLYSIKTDGPEIWNTKKGEINCVNAVFVYKGAEYIYVGGMSNDTMKEFLDSLS